MPNFYNLFELLEDKGAFVNMARNIGISVCSMSDWKRGRSKPGMDSLIKIAKYFDVSIDYLVGRSDVC